MSKWLHRLTNKNLIDKTANCSICGHVNIRVRHSKNGKIIIRCRNAYNASKHGTSSKFPTKPDVCPICLKRKKLCFDHNHQTNTFRGWICLQCNSAIGLVYEDENILDRMKTYLLRNSVVGNTTDSESVNARFET